MAPPASSFVVTREDEGRRLDQVLALRVAGLSRRKARTLIDIGGVFVDGARVKVASRTLRAGQRVEAHVGGALDRATKEVGRAARERDERALPPYSIVFEDSDVVVVDKPAGLLTAPTPEADRYNLADVLSRRPGKGQVFVVHRLDLPTSGLLVFARSEHANRVLSERFVRHDVDREYLAVLRGSLEAPIVVDAPIAGRAAQTRITPEERLSCGATIVRCRLETGRTHQIRIHTSGLGHPVLGDPKYGKAGELGAPRLALHAHRLGFDHPRTSERLVFESPPPPDLAAWIEALRRAPS